MWSSIKDKTENNVSSIHSWVSPNRETENEMKETLWVSILSWAVFHLMRLTETMKSWSTLDKTIPVCTDRNLKENSATKAFRWPECILAFTKYSFRDLQIEQMFTEIMKVPKFWWYFVYLNVLDSPEARHWVSDIRSGAIPAVYFTSVTKRAHLFCCVWVKNLPLNRPRGRDKHVMFPCRASGASQVMVFRKD